MSKYRNGFLFAMVLKALVKMLKYLYIMNWQVCIISRAKCAFQVAVAAFLSGPALYVLGHQPASVVIHSYYPAATVIRNHNESSMGTSNQQQSFRVITQHQQSSTRYHQSPMGNLSRVVDVYHQGSVCMYVKGSGIFFCITVIVSLSDTPSDHLASNIITWHRLTLSTLNIVAQQLDNNVIVTYITTCTEFSNYKKVLNDTRGTSLND